MAFDFSDGILTAASALYKGRTEGTVTTYVLVSKKTPGVFIARLRTGGQIRALGSRSKKDRGKLRLQARAETRDDAQRKLYGRVMGKLLARRIGANVILQWPGESAQILPPRAPPPLDRLAYEAKRGNRKFLAFWLGDDVIAATDLKTAVMRIWQLGVLPLPRSNRALLAAASVGRVVPSRLRANLRRMGVTIR